MEFWSRTLEFGTELEQNFRVEIWYMTQIVTRIHQNMDIGSLSSIKNSQEDRTRIGRVPLLV